MPEQSSFVKKGNAWHNLADVPGISSYLSCKISARKPDFVTASSAEPQKSPKRTRLLAGDFILDIVETAAALQPFTYMVHRRSSGEILTIGEALSFLQAERAAIWTVKQIIGEDPGFNFDELDRDAVA